MFSEFPEINPEEMDKKLEALLGRVRAKIKDLKGIEHKTFNNFLKPYQDLSGEIDLLWTPFEILQSTKNSPATNAAYKKCLPILSEFSTEQAQDLGLYAACCEIRQNDKTMNAEQEKVLGDLILAFEMGGALLDERQKKKIAEINMFLSDLENEFSQNVLDATKDFTVIVKPEDEEKLGDMPADVKDLFKEEYGFVFNLQSHSYTNFMNYCVDRQLREEMYKGYFTRAPQNEAILEAILQLKRKKAQILGYKNYAEYSLKTKMAQSPKHVLDFLERLLKASKPAAKKELASLKSVAKFDITEHDKNYWSQKLFEQSYGVKQDEYKPYFEKNAVVKGLLKVLQKLFGLEFKEVRAKVWDDAVLTYDIFEASELIARIYMDLEARPEKKGGAWMNSWQTRRKDANGQIHLPSAYIVCNFPPQKGDLPSLLTHQDVVTLFHEMGHALQHLLTNVDEYLVSGINGIEWDAVEFPSQWLENFAYEKDVLELFARHYKTKKPLDERKIDALVAAKNFQSGLAMLRQLEFGIFDMTIHIKAKTRKEVQRILHGVAQKTSLIPAPSYKKFQNAFSHIFSGGYAAGYYSYKWAEVLSADAFYFFKGRTFNKPAAKRFRQTVLGLGASKKASEVFKEFAKREPSQDALLKLSGITA
ncbi:MAG: M3 family metallopeptidase [Helicobacteraceae bacterium]